jgi:uncharacterized protein YfaS (alpha-2-macroglobulin family)
LVSRDLTVEATLPLALAPGDSFLAIVKIFTDKLAQVSPEASISFETEGPLTVIKAEDENGAIDPASYHPQISANQSKTVKLWLTGRPKTTKDSSVGQASLVVKVNGIAQPFVQKTHTVVRPPFPRITRSIGGRLDATGSLTFDLEGFLVGTAKSYFSLSSGPSAELGRAVSYLMEYPYGCLEQTISQAWVHLAALDLGEFISSFDTIAPEIALSGALARIATMQTFQGGYSTWPRGNVPYEWGSVYAAHFLTHASERMELPKGTLDDALEYAESLLNSNIHNFNNDVYGMSTKAYALFVLALNGRYESGWINSLKDRPQYLNASARIFLAGAEALRDRNPTALERLERELDAELPEAFGMPDSQARDLSLRLLAWTYVDPLSPKTAELAGLLASDGRADRWRNTQENGLAVLALSSFLTKSAAGLPYHAEVSDFQGTVLAEGTHLAPISLGNKTLGAINNQPLRVKLSGDGKPWYNMTVTGVPLSSPEPVQEGLKVKRAWQVPGPDGPIWVDPVDPKNSGLVISKSNGDQNERSQDAGAQNGKSQEAGSQNDGLIETSQTPTITIERGSLVKVELTIDAENPLENVVIAELLPGGLEVVSASETKDDLYDDESKGDDYDDYDDQPSSQASYIRLEPREDRVIVIIDYLSGQKTVNFELRAVTSGLFVIPPTTAEAMYEPQKRAILSEGLLEIIEK